MPDGPELFAGTSLALKAGKWSMNYLSTTSFYSDWHGVACGAGSALKEKWEKTCSKEEKKPFAKNGSE